MTALDVLSRIRFYGSSTNCTTANNDKVHKWYENTYHVTVEKIGTLIPKWDNRIQTVIDGIVNDGIIDIRRSNTMYKSLTHHTEKINNGWIPEKYYHDHMFDDHYIQMQANMKICNKLWCDYIVFVKQGNQVYTERVYFNEKYWNEVWPTIDDYITNVLIPTISVDI